MSNIYPTLEDLKVDHMMKAQVHVAQQQEAQRQGLPSNPQATASGADALYPCLGDYMGLAVPPGSQAVAVPASSSLTQMVAPITGNANQGLLRSEIKEGVRQIVLCKDGDLKIGLRVQAVNKGIFVAFVYTNSPAALVGLRFGDQILEINDNVVAGWSTDQTLKYLRKCPPDNIRMVIRDRPFERVITMQKDSAGYIGFIFKNGKITNIVKDSSAARNGILIEHNLIEVHGQNVVGLKDKELQKIIESTGRTVTVTVMPSHVFDHMMKHIGWSLVKKSMDHSIPEI